MKKMLFLINPNAGNSGIRTKLLDVTQVFCSAGFEVRVHTTSGPREITEVITREGMDYDVVVSSGGDGTLNETVAGLMRLEKRPVLGYIPAGTVNDMAASLGLSMDVMEAAKTIVAGEPMELDVGTLNGRPYAYVAAFGAFTDVAYATPQDVKRALGRLAYLLKGVTALTDIRPIHARIYADGVEDEDDFLLGMMCSTRSIGGFRAFRIPHVDISLNDGLSEVLFVRHIKKLTDVSELLNQLVKMDFLDQRRFLSLQAKNIRVEFDRDVAWTVDGEDGGRCTEALLENHHSAIRVMVPKREN